MDQQPFLYFLSEFLGTFVLMLIGLGVNANVSLKKTKGFNSGWIVITWGWAMGVLIGATIALYSGGQLNPAVAVGLWATKQITISFFFLAIAGQLFGAFVASLLIVYLFWDHFKATDNADAVAGTFFTSPAIKSPLRNFMTEIFGTFVLVGGILFATIYSKSTNGLLPALLYGPLFAGLIVFAVGLTLGGLTGYAINPCRDLCPRLAHWLMPVPNKGSSHWSYVWVPVIGPIVGALFAVAIAYIALVIGNGEIGDVPNWGANVASLNLFLYI